MYNIHNEKRKERTECDGRKIPLNGLRTVQRAACATSENPSLDGPKAAVIGKRGTFSVSHTQARKERFELFPWYRLIV